MKMPKPQPNRMVISGKFFRWLAENGQLAAFDNLRALQDRYMQESNNSNHGYRSVSTEKLLEISAKYEGRQAHIREELRRRGV